MSVFGFGSGNLGFWVKTGIFKPADTQFFKEIRYSKIENPKTTQTNDIHHTTYCYYTEVCKCERIVVLRYLHKMSATRRTSQRAMAISSIQVVCRSVK